MKQCPDYWGDEKQIWADLELEAIGQDKIQIPGHGARARALVKKFVAGELSKDDDAGTREAMKETGLLQEDEDPLFKEMELNLGQARLEKALLKQLDRAKVAREATSDAAYRGRLGQQEAACRHWTPGHWQDHGGGQVRDFAKVLQMWEAADRLPCLIFAADFWQLPDVQPTRATDSPKWKQVLQIELLEMWRCKDEVLREKLVALRTAMPDKKLLKRICWKHKAWSGHQIRSRTAPQTCTRRALQPL